MGMTAMVNVVRVSRTGGMLAGERLRCSDGDSSRTSRSCQPGAGVAVVHVREADFKWATKQRDAGKQRGEAP